MLLVLFILRSVWVGPDKGVDIDVDWLVGEIEGDILGEMDELLSCRYEEGGRLLLFELLDDWYEEYIPSGAL
jgi:hypothetical protein